VENSQQTCDRSYDNLRTKLKIFVKSGAWFCVRATRQAYGTARGAQVGMIFGRFLKFSGSSQACTTIPGWDEEAACTSWVSPSNTEITLHYATLHWVTR